MSKICNFIQLGGYLADDHWQKIMIPEPHPLDFDWRFSKGTIEKVSKLIPDREKDILLVGTPSLATVLNSRGVQITLVDRQPVQDVDSVENINPDIDGPIAREFGITILDPPWYEETYFRWISWAAQSMKGSGSVLYCTIWQPEIRPKGIEERERIFKWLETWADYAITENYFEYETPLFEERASAASGLSSAPLWRKGDLLEIRPRLRPSLASPLVQLESWYRIIINSYQLAVRIDNVVDPRITKHPTAEGWVWKSVSRRAPGRGQIGLWSSRNEVAIIEGSKSIINAVQELAQLGKINDENLKSLLEWEIPKSKTHQFREWKHQN